MNILNSGFRYTPAAKTDLSARFAAENRRLGIGCEICGKLACRCNAEEEYSPPATNHDMTEDERLDDPRRG